MREIGPAFKVFANAQLGREGQNETKPYIGLARVLLGMLKNRMSQGGLAQGQSVCELPDGTRIVVASAYGIDKLAIVAPDAPLPESVEPQVSIPMPELDELDIPIPEQEIASEHYTILGTSVDDAGQHAVIWRGLGGQPIDLGFLPGSSTNTPGDISEDGTTAVGYADVDGRGRRAWKWTHAAGMQELPTPPSTVESRAFSCSQDGSVIGGLINNSQPCIWNDRGIVVLSDLGYGGAVSRVSTNGAWACGTVFRSAPADGEITEGALWDLSTSDPALTVIPRPGTSHEQITTPTTSDTIADVCLPADVTAAGLVCGSTTATTLSEFTYYWEPAILGSGSQLQEDMPDAKQLFFYDTHLGLKVIDGRAASVVAIADRVGAVVGNHNIGEKISYTVTAPRVGEPPAIEHIFDQWQGLYALPWAWTARAGYVDMQSENSVARDISEDGRVVVGNDLTSDGTTHPIIWLGVRSAPRRLALLEGGVTGSACSVATTLVPPVSI